jgi:hypothetical protein
MSWLRGAAQGGPGEPSGSGGLTRATEQRPDERDRELDRRADAVTLNVFAGLAGVPLVLGLFGAERFWLTVSLCAAFLLTALANALIRIAPYNQS